MSDGVKRYQDMTRDERIKESDRYAVSEIEKELRRKVEVQKADKPKKDSGLPPDLGTSKSVFETVLGAFKRYLKRKM